MSLELLKRPRSIFQTNSRGGQINPKLASCFNGAMNEALFDAFALSVGWHIAYPGLDFAKYDRLASSDGGKTWSKVQVKTSYDKKIKGITIGAVTLHNGTKSGYSPGDWDYLFVMHGGGSYYIPYEEVGNRTCIYFGSKKNAWGKFRVGDAVGFGE